MILFKITVTTIICLWASIIFAQYKLTLSGCIKDSKNGEGLIGTSVYVKELRSRMVMYWQDLFG